MMLSFFRSPAAGVLLVASLLIGAPASAAVITYNSLATWQSAVTGVSTDAFTDTLAYSPNTSSSGFTRASGVNFLGTYNGGTQFYTLEQNLGSFGGHTIMGADQPTFNDNTLTITLPNATTAVGFDLMFHYNNSNAGASDGVQITVAGNTTSFASLPTNPSSIFFGVTSDTTFTTITLVSTARGASTLKDFSIASFSNGGGGGTQAPEGGTLVLMGGGLFAISYLARRQKNLILT